MNSSISECIRVHGIVKEENELSQRRKTITDLWYIKDQRKTSHKKDKLIITARYC